MMTDTDEVYRGLPSDLELFSAAYSGVCEIITFGKPDDPYSVCRDRLSIDANGAVETTRRMRLRGTAKFLSVPLTFDFNFDKPKEKR